MRIRLAVGETVKLTFHGGVAEIGGNKIPGLYSQDALAPTDFAWKPPEFSGIAISHIHFDHVNQLQFADPDIPVFLGEGTQIMLDSWMTTARSMDLGPHAWKTFRTGRSVSVDGLEIEPIHVDPSAPAAS